MADQNSKSSTRMDIGTRLAFDRTRLAYDRTMLAWVRTAASLISFGFTIYKFFQIENSKGETPRPHLLGARGFALIMIGFGLVSLLLATIQHGRDRTAMIAMDPDVPRSMAGALAGLIAVLGIVAFWAVMFRQ